MSSKRELSKRESMAWVTYQNMLGSGMRPRSDNRYDEIVDKAFMATDAFMAQTDTIREAKDAETKARFEEKAQIEEDLY